MAGGGDNSSGNGDEDIVNATQTELAFFLVIVFVMALGLPTNQPGDDAAPKAAPMVALQPLPPSIDPLPDVFRKAAKPKPEEPKGPVATPPPGFDGDTARPDRVSRCFAVEGNKLTWFMDGRAGATARTSTWAPSASDRTAGESEPEHGLQFPDYRWELTLAGQHCLVEICGALLDRVRAEGPSLKHVLIEGHTSSGWRDPRSCRAMARATTPADKKLAADACNRRLSEERAKTAYEFCRSYNLSERLLSEDDFVRSFRTDGRGSLDVRLDADTGREDAIASRRVEFVFVPVERAKSAAR